MSVKFHASVLILQCLRQHQKIFEKSLDIRRRICYSRIKQSAGGQLRKEAQPMSTEEILALLMLILAAIRLGYDLKK